MERLYGGWLCYGPPVENGFYYDMYMEDHQVSNTDFPSIENLMKKIVKEKQPFERLEMKKEDLLEMFKVSNSICCSTSLLKRMFFLKLLSLIRI